MMSENIIILGIETSCDDTSAAVLSGRKVLTNIVSSQKIHAQWGGVVPELASRAHHLSILPVVETALKEAGVSKKQLTAIAYTRGPGLMGSLLVGSSFARAMGSALNIPTIPVHHMEAHILAHFIEDEIQTPPEFPFLCLTVSGGHTQLVLVSDFTAMEVLGQTTDDAAGEAFDKIAKLLGLPYPGGPMIDRLAKSGNPSAFQFARPVVAGYDYSFSGLKTSVLYTLEKYIAKDPDFIQKNLNDIAASVQQAIIDTLLKKLLQALKDTNIKRLAVAGGVSANSTLRESLKKLADKNNIKLYLPNPAYCTDNGAMIAITGYYYFTKKISRTDGHMSPVARWMVGK
ncbi:tRNA (adenosine(37)-N6)-threonylcarbamoyltransferase complex transferase subunit TsaD [Schleiferia thermophila]|uniref:tRNA (adenosine(37)-N6)-threonylcarbamoyltransferase complex transferase subunit TsaD n=1 Tax=Schleiferia thermophila TaxID=884107 RepID=UPI0004E794A2|nr:tRNA (adenosine(37)-N6)-threonylcarbamoyltransferase complex transferase subunit TsaD [Schleiferia thermophila]KFD39988.1 O-sialoglycoprotein endopeptidase [Schleiferia thermophila str. Yellowstone]